jgi:hypothetical protein
MARATPAPPRYATDGLWMTDGQGRDLFLRGFDLSGAEYTPTGDALPYGTSDLAAIRAAGGTVVRLPIAWALLEPQPGHIDPAAVARVVQIVDWAGAAGLKVVLDMHQYLWAPCLGGLGIPDWAVPNCPSTPPTNIAEQEADIQVAAAAFWDSPTLQADFATVWATVVKAVGAPSFLLGYDILNEPPPGTFPPEVFESSVLAPFYREIGTRIRAIDPGSLLFVEPSILNGLVNGVSEFLGPIGLPDVVYEPHQYGAVSFNADTSVSVADLAGPEQFLPDLTIDRAVAQRMGAALWLGEWGAITPSASYRPVNYVEDDTTEQDRFLMGSAYWSLDSAAADPAILAALTGVTPEAIAGSPTAISGGSLSWTSDGGPTAFALPAGCAPVVHVGEGRATWTADAGTVTVTAPAGQATRATVSCGSPGASPQ